MANQDIAVIGASAGGVEALRKIAAALPEDYRGSIFVVLHISPSAPTVLHNILSRSGPVPAMLAQDGDPIRPGRIYVAVPDRHLVVEQGKMRTSFGARENRHRPSIDVLFRSAARAYGPRVVAVLLSGMRSDGISGMHAVNRMGGTVLVQDPDEALFPSLPSAGIELDNPDKVLRVEEIAAELVKRSTMEASAHTTVPVDLERELRFAKGEIGPQDTPPGQPSQYACPDCNGALWKIEEEGAERYRCRVGHAFSESDLVLAKAETLENALWAAMRALEESASVERRAAQRTGGEGRGRLHDSARAKGRQAEIIRNMLLGTPPLERTGTAE